jgi:hypothetical protein
MERRMKLIPEEYFKVENTRPMDNRYYLVPKLHQAFHHYIKVMCDLRSYATVRVRV